MSLAFAKRSLCKMLGSLSPSAVLRPTSELPVPSQPLVCSGLHRSSPFEYELQPYYRVHPSLLATVHSYQREALPKQRTGILSLAIGPVLYPCC